MSECPNEEQLGAFVDAELPAEVARVVEAHVASCAACGQAVAAYRRLDAAMREAEAPPVADDVWAATWAAIADRTGMAVERQWVPAAADAGWRERVSRLRWVAAAAVMALAIGLWSHLVPNRNVPEVAVTTPVVVEYLESAEGYTSLHTQSEDADLTLITVMAVDEP